MWQQIVELDIRADDFEAYRQLVAELNVEDKEHVTVGAEVREDEHAMAA